MTTINPILSLSGVIDRTNSDDMAKIILFDTLRRSKGFKLLYYNSTATDMSGGGSTDGWDTIIQKLGIDNIDGNTNQDGIVVSDAHTQSGGELFNNGDPFPHLHVFVVGVSIIQSSIKERLNYQLTLQIGKNASA